MSLLPSLEPNSPLTHQRTPRSRSRRVDVAVIGAGIVGLGIAWALARSGRSVQIIDPDPGMGATRAAAGMLAPVSEYHYQEEQLLKLTLASARLYPRFIKTLEDLGKATGYLRTETLLIGIDAADRTALRELYEIQTRHGLPVEPLTIRDARAREPLLAPHVSTAYRVKDDHQVDPRILSTALRDALGQEDSLRGAVRFNHRTATRIVHTRPHDPLSAVIGVELADGSTVEAGEVIVANGVAAKNIHGLPPALSLPLRPVFGEIVRVTVPQPLQPLVNATIRGMVRGEAVYIVPRGDGTAVIGATQRETGSTGVSAGGIYTLLRDAQQLVPAISETDICEIMARPRPGTPDNGPLLGRVRGRDDSHVDGLIIATGFYRHGVLLTPLTAQICLHLVDGTSDTRWLPFRPDRFPPNPPFKE